MVAQDGGQALELAVHVVEGVCAEWRAGGRVVWVGVDEALHHGRRRLREVELVQERDELGTGAEIGLSEGEERALVLLVTYDEGDFGVAPGRGEDVHRVGDRVAVHTRGTGVGNSTSASCHTWWQGDEQARRRLGALTKTAGRRCSRR